MRFYLSEEEYKAGAALVAKIEADRKAALGANEIRYMLITFLPAAPLRFMRPPIQPIAPRLLNAPKNRKHRKSPQPAGKLWTKKWGLANLDASTGGDAKQMKELQLAEELRLALKLVPASYLKDFL